MLNIVVTKRRIVAYFRSKESRIGVLLVLCGLLIVITRLIGTQNWHWNDVFALFFGSFYILWGAGRLSPPLKQFFIRIYAPFRQLYLHISFDHAALARPQTTAKIAIIL